MIHEETLSLYTMQPDGFFTAHGAANPPRPDALVDLYEYWAELAGERDVPHKQNLDPAAFHKILPHIVLTEVRYEPLDFIYRLIGEHIVQNASRSMQGQSLSELANSGSERDRHLQAHLQAIGDAVITTRAAVFADLSYETIPTGAQKLLQCTCLPLEDDDGVITHIICAAVYEDISRKETAQDGQTASAVREGN